MGTVGLSFGSPTSGQGFDVATTVTSILAIAQGIESPWKTQLTALAAQDAVFTTLGTDLSTLSTALSSLTNFDGVLSSKEGSSSNDSVLTLTQASSTAVAGSHTIIVNGLAKTSSYYSNQITNSSDTLSGSLTLQVGSGTSQTITLDSTNNTLASLATAINQGSYGVTASVVTDTNGSRLSLVSGTSGAGGQITLGGSLNDDTAGSAVSFAVGQTGTDATLNVDGIDTTSASNTVSNVIPGVTFQLLSSSPGTQVQVQVTNDNSSIETALQSVVTAYNAVVKDISTQEGKDSTGSAEPLYGNPTLSLLQTQLSSALFTGAASGSIKSIADLGLTVGTDGTLSLSQSTLDSVLNTNFNDVSTFLQGSNGFGQTFATTLNQLGSSSSQGAVSLALAQNSTQEATLNTNVTNQEARVAAEKITLTDELNAANQILQGIPQQLDALDQLYAAFTGFNQSVSGS